MRQRFTLAGRLAHLSLFTAACFGAVQSIDCGSVADTGFSAGAWPAPGGSIAYSIPNPPCGGIGCHPALLRLLFVHDSDYRRPAVHRNAELCGDVGGWTIPEAVLRFDQ